VSCILYYVAVSIICFSIIQKKILIDCFCFCWCSPPILWWVYSSFDRKSRERVLYLLVSLVGRYQRLFEGFDLAFVVCWSWETIYDRWVLGSSLV
jgi:hypothetical protein